MIIAHNTIKRMGSVQVNHRNSVAINTILFLQLLIPAGGQIDCWYRLSQPIITYTDTNILSSESKSDQCFDFPLVCVCMKTMR